MNSKGGCRYLDFAMATLVTLTLATTALSPPAGATTGRPYFTQARNLWLGEAQMVSSALQNVPLVAAANYLERGLSVRGADVSGYATAIATIKSFERIPITSETRAQVRASHSDWAALNTFFQLTAGDVSVLDNDIPSGAPYNAAQRAWLREPEGVERGLNDSSLKTLVAILRAAKAARPQRAIIYQAALVDAQSLESASPRDIALSGRTLINPYGQDVYYLNVFFRASQL
jgi:hypothetical protein